MVDFLEKKVSEIHGYGMFTKRRISEGEEFYKVPLDAIADENNPRFAYIGNGKYVSDEKVLNWVNHSCSPNTLLDIEREDPVLVAVKNVLPGEEITCDYDRTEVHGLKIRCDCKSENCRDYFTGLVWKL